MADEKTPKTMTTAEAAKVLGISTDTVHMMKTEGRLTVVGKGTNGTNLNAANDVHAVKARREKPSRRPLPNLYGRVESTVRRVAERAGDEGRPVTITVDDRMPREDDK
ncbi:hypothetical protein [Streptomyces minutiscleroticus]|uniref:hypothetical protein n=1 Tax=Streptomyces minutiscleroticus TaxID=68238 RepID=UPI003328A4AA